MSDEDDKAKIVLPENLPGCPCFQVDDDFTLGRCNAVTDAAQQIGAKMMQLVKKSNLCAEALPYLLDVVILTMSVQIAIGGTIIQVGSEDAERETMRVLEGMEARIKARAAEGYRVAREMGLQYGFEKLDGGTLQ